MKRLFIAVKLIPDDNLLKIYYSLKKALQYDKIRWVHPDNFHITLKFLGTTPEEKISTISEVMINTLTLTKVLDIELNNVGIFGSKYKPRVIWFGINENKQMKNLGIRLLDSLHNAGFPKDRQNFIPHLTVGRITKITGKQLFNYEIEKVRNVYIQKVAIDRVILYESILTSKAPIYNELFSFPLSN
ncbi:MAG: RNA 2',3'-cyclic phosphodiesterase [Bacteroidetes bacterium]|mgnify:FL=1|nr:RNA 2',3'-cyclic phosphodiesterase [Bacteroidota bacterium]|tara:strand:- start:2190 stop:2750 length:561 start_codon:yes stop_codon:yes gene_type:complete